MAKKTKKAYIQFLNEIGETLSKDSFIIGGKMRNGKYGDMLYRHDPIAFIVSYHDWLDS